MSVPDYWVPKREAWQRELCDQLGRGAVASGSGIVLGTILGLCLWLLIILAAVSLV